ncbi:MAG: hypothetical protein A2Z81_03515 [Omnitrophica WOR_2 bacterium GWA2_45_18]|nr:MAG: hypothetical protein A2Z81_03515 [Omnitrophica WOR_2 bacterium GWA2_45_18]
MEMMKKLLETVSQQEQLDTALAAAVMGNQTSVIKYLIEKGAHANPTNFKDTGLLINAIMHERYEAAKALIEAGAEVNIKGYKRIIHGIQVDWDWTPLMCSAYKGQLSLVELLIEKGSDIHQKGSSNSRSDLETSADIAAYSGHLDILKLLIDKGSELNEETIYKSVRGGHVQIVEYLLSKGIEINRLSASSGKTLLMEASWWGHLDFVNLFIKNGADVNIIGTNGYTALSEAISNSNEEFPNQVAVVNLLLEHGANTNITDKYRMTPLMLAVKSNNQEIIDLLIKKGAKY